MLITPSRKIPDIKTWQSWPRAGPLSVSSMPFAFCFVLGTAFQFPFSVLFWPAVQLAIPQPGFELGSQQWTPRILTTRPPGNIPVSFITNLQFHCASNAVTSPVPPSLFICLVFVRMAFGQVQFHLIAFQDEPLEDGRELDAGQKNEAKNEALMLEKHERVEERRNLLNRPISSTSFKKWIQSGSLLMNKNLCLFLPVF